ncbi:MAG TPA: hypothetical protein VHL08_02705 [Dongiaceae bacterium]|nr:hypothetical protein [Dongiaceae bacterium]
MSQVHRDNDVLTAEISVSSPNPGQRGVTEVKGTKREETRDSPTHSPAMLRL